MINVKEINLKDVSEWRTELVNELEQLESDKKAKEQQLDLLENKKEILDRVAQGFSDDPDWKKLFWEEYGKPIEEEFSEKNKEFDYFRRENFKKQRAIGTIINRIEFYLKREGFKF